MSYKYNSIQSLEDQNEDFIPEDNQETSIKMAQYSKINIGASVNKASEGMSPKRSIKRQFSLISQLQSDSPIQKSFNRKNIKHQTTNSFVQSRIKRLGNCQQSSFLSQIDLEFNNSSNEKISISNTSPTSSQFRKQRQQPSNKHVTFFTEFYQNAIIEYVD
ncbi:hypothetical protein TTHERM_00474680 (macronuclear) [Tetrahymena thermophila SB210]|uniref:Uncharacterized protein n=1 Tax=Tetrahymena thermophila (strain SB210) TaxID=312017 RepID=I7M3L8_TETTS|nr:hypothetical protein TTHERM_00474680 [Tetrahymena thermophila SB210]EAS03706.2 hypothetical protein TTHERM_00474680 [Tetrahymena thermophila SB210]|eukprot:XP_001023951.2 hypothetical protein TTHERM_00474680 [Tetrahymena thermophila SB210]